MCLAPDDYGRGTAQFIVALVNRFRSGRIVEVQVEIADAPGLEERLPGVLPSA